LELYLIFDVAWWKLYATLIFHDLFHVAQQATNKTDSSSRVFAKRRTPSNWMLCSRKSLAFFILTAVRMKTDVFLSVMTSSLVVFSSVSEETTASIFMVRSAEGGRNFIRSTDKQDVTLQKVTVVLL
jgi:hypothetical protein